MKKRIISLAVSVLMLLSLIPLQALAETIILPFPDDDDSSMIIKPWYPNADSGYGYNSKISGEAIFSAMMEQAESGKAPDSFNDDTLTPYGTQKNEAFTILDDGSKLSTKTIAEHHGLISAVLEQAVRDGLIPINVAARATPPKV